MSGKLKPGQPAPRSGEYGIVGPRGERLVKSEQPYKGSRCLLRLSQDRATQWTDPPTTARASLPKSDDVRRV